MNNIQKLNYCPFIRSVFVVSGPLKEKKKSSFRNKKLVALIFITSSIPFKSHASVVRNDIPYQVYRDFAENRGQFIPGVTGTHVYKKDGTLFSIIKEPMPDWSFASNGGVASLINPHYTSTTKHTKGRWATSPRFGGSGQNPDYHRYTYKSVRYNEESINYDYSFHRLNKLVTDVVPINHIDKDRADIPYTDADRYPIFARMGNGYQRIIDAEGVITNVADTRVYVTGGTFGSPRINKGVWDDITINYYADSEIDLIFNMFPDKLFTKGRPGDSGSSLIVWDALEKKWYLAGQYYGGNDTSNRWMIPHAGLIRDAMNSDDLTPFTSVGNASINWSYDSATASGAITQDQQTLAMTGARGTDNDGLDFGKNITFTGDDGTVLLSGDINQGAGSIKFKGNYVVTPETDESWMGAGLDIDAGKNVTWQVNGVQGDSLHKIGQGTLTVNGKGANPGGLRVGDGTVILNQQDDASFNKQAFSTLDIVSGRPTVVLSDSNQVNPNNIYFGFRGGRLDLNGNSLTFERIHNVDTGAQIVNHNNGQGSRGEVTITGTSTAANQTFQGVLGETDNAKTNGLMTFNFAPLNKSSVLLLSGGANLNGDMNVTGGTTLLSGRPVLHARADYTPGSQINDGEDWLRSSFIFKELNVRDGAVLQIGEYSDVGPRAQDDLPSMNLLGNATAVLGYHNDSDDKLNVFRCYLDDNNGDTTCAKPNLSASDINPGAVARVNANIALLNSNNVLQLGSVELHGSITDDSSSVVQMGSNSYWKVAGSSRLFGAAFNGARVDLGSDAGTSGWTPKPLEIQRLNSSGAVYTLGLNAITPDVTADTLVINGSATGASNFIHIAGVPGSQQENLPVDGFAMVTAPQGTDHDLFEFSSENIGFSSVKPFSTVVDDINDGNKVKWLLLGGSDRATASDNVPLLNHTKSFMQTRQFAATESLAHLTDRTTALRSGGEASGSWGAIREDKGRHGGRSLRQTTLTLGVDGTKGSSTTGIMANIHQGSDSGNDGHAKYVQGGVGVYNSLGSGEGLFLDSALSYQLYRQNLSFSPILGDLPGKSYSNMVLFSARAGYTLKFRPHNVFIEPVVGLDTGYLDGYTHSNDTVTLEQKSGYPTYAVGGLRVGKHFGQSNDRGTTVIVSAMRQQSVGRSAPGITLSDAYKSRDYAALEDNRHRFDVSLQSRISNKLSANVAVGYSKGDNFSTDYSGRVELAYSF